MDFTVQFIIDAADSTEAANIVEGWAVSPGARLTAIHGAVYDTARFDPITVGGDGVVPPVDCSLLTLRPHGRRAQ